MGKGEGGNQVGKGFSHPGAGFHGEMFASAEGGVDPFGHFHLAGAELEIGKLLGEKAGGGENLIDVEIHARELVLNHVRPRHVRRSGLFADEGVAALILNYDAQEVV